MRRVDGNGLLLTVDRKFSSSLTISSTKSSSSKEDDSSTGSASFFSALSTLVEPVYSIDFYECFCFLVGFFSGSSNDRLV